MYNFLQCTVPITQMKGINSANSMYCQSYNAESEPMSYMECGPGGFNGIYDGDADYVSATYKLV